MSEEYKLESPIDAHGESLSVLNIRRPTPQEARAIKALPYKMDSNSDVTLDLEVAAKYIAVCASIPPSAVNQLDLSDFNALSWKVAGFFLTAASATLKA